MKNRNYCFTVFKDKLVDGKITSKGFEQKIKYLVFQEEKAPSTDRLHYQGYLELNTPMRMNAVKQLFTTPSVHLEKRQGSREQAIAYCKKGVTRIAGPWEWGDVDNSQGHRTDLDEVANLIKQNKNLNDIVQQCPVAYIKYNRGIREAMNILNKDNKDRDIVTTVLWGPTGCGKTRKAMEGNRDDIFKIDLIGDTFWFDGYEGQKTLVIDEFYGQCKPSLLLKLLDRYPLRVPIKGSSVQAKWTKVYITSNRKPEDWYPTISDEVQKAVLRRLTKIVKMEVPV